MLTMHAVEARFPMRSGRRLMNAKVLVMALGALAMVGCTPDWAKNGDAPVVVPWTAKLEPPFANRAGAHPPVLTMFAEVTLHARTTTGQTTNPVSARLHIDFAQFDDDVTTCPVAQ